MIGVNEVICLSLISCFGERILNQIPDQMKCNLYSAPKDGYGKTDSKSLICDNIDYLTVTNLKPLEPFNTLAVGIDEEVGSQERKEPSNYQFSINNLYLYGTRTGSPLSGFWSISQMIGLNDNALEELSLVKLNLDNFEWRHLQSFTELKSINIKDCELSQLNHNNFGLLSGSKIISVSIINSGVKEIKNFPFNGWNQLKMLSIIGNPLEEIPLSQNKIENLWSLELHNNYIKQIPGNFDTNLPKLRALNLNNNNLKSVKWQNIQPLLKLTQFSLDGNTICMNKDVIEIYDNLKTSSDWPTFFRDSMNNIQCKDVSTPGLADSDTGFYCKLYDTSGWTGIHDTQYVEHCDQWQGEKKRLDKKRELP